MSSVFGESSKAVEEALKDAVDEVRGRCLGGGFNGVLLGREAVGKVLDGAGPEAAAILGNIKAECDAAAAAWLKEQEAWVAKNVVPAGGGKRAGVLSPVSRFRRLASEVLRDPSKSGDAVMLRLAGCVLDGLEAACRNADGQYPGNVMWLENLTAFTSSLPPEAKGALEPALSKASAVTRDRLKSYTEWSIGREFKSLSLLFQNVTRIRSDVGAADVVIHLPKSSFFRSLKLDLVPEKIKAARARVEKHFVSGMGVDRVWREITERLQSMFRDWAKVSAEVYGHRLAVTADEIKRQCAEQAGDTERSARPARQRSGGSKQH